MAPKPVPEPPFQKSHTHNRLTEAQKLLVGYEGIGLLINALKKAEDSITQMQKQLLTLGEALQIKPTEVTMQRNLVLMQNLSAEHNTWGSCVWYDFTAEQTGSALERLGRNRPPDFGCPDGTFMTHVDHDAIGGIGWVVTHTRCCKP